MYFNRKCFLVNIEYLEPERRLGLVRWINSEEFQNQKSDKLKLCHHWVHYQKAPNMEWHVVMGIREGYQ